MLLNGNLHKASITVRNMKYTSRLKSKQKDWNTNSGKLKAHKRRTDVPNSKTIFSHPHKQSSMIIQGGEKAS